MLLSLFRLTMIVPLLISAVYIEANSEKSSFVPSEVNKAVVESPGQNNGYLKGDAKSVDGNEADPLVQKRRLKRRNSRYNDHESRPRRGGVNTMENRLVRSGDKGLAHKMAKDALKSPKMQETMKKLTRVSKPRGNLYASVKLPAPVPGRAKKLRSDRNRGRHKGRRKKKRKRHHRRYKNEHTGWPKRGSSKRTSNNGGDINASAKKFSGTRDSIIKRNQVVNDNESRDKSSSMRSNEIVAAVGAGDGDYVDLSSPLNTESSVKLTKPVKLHENEKMIERLMRTTTKDPLKKNPGDQGIEYSDYYSDDDVLHDMAANKIPMQIVESGNTNDRFARQAANSTLLRIDRNVVQPYRRDRDTRRKGFRYIDDSVKGFPDFQDYPKVERYAGLNRHSRYLGADDPSLSYLPSYKPSDDRNEHFDATYPIDSGEVLEQPRIPEEDTVPELRDNLDPSNSLNGEIQQPAFEAQNPEQFNYLNRYENQNEAQNLNVNEAVDAQMDSTRFLQDKNPLVEIPQSSNSFSSPELQNLQNSQYYQQAEMNTQEIGNLDRNTMNQPRMESVRLSNVKEDEVPSQPSFPESYNNPDGNDRASNDFQTQGRDNFPALSYVPNAMEQPLGKVLESLGINVNADTSDLNRNPNSGEESVSLLANNTMDGIDGALSHSRSLDQSTEHVLSPSYIKQKHKEDASGRNNDGNNGGKSNDLARSKNEHDAREGHSRRQSNQNGPYDDNQFLPYTDEPKVPVHHTNISIAVQDTKEVANKILDTVMEELEELKLDRAKNDKREGSWSTAQAGMKLDMRVVNRTIIANVSEHTTPRFHESLLNGTWNVSGHAPFKRGSPFTLIATDNSTKSIAVFVGACRVCQGIDTIAGVWSVARQPKDCRDFQVATSVFNDIFKKTTLSSLREKQNSTEHTTPKHEKRKS